MTLTSGGNASLSRFRSASIEKCLLLAQPHNDGGFTVVKCGKVGRDQIADRAASGERADGNEEEKGAQQIQAS